MNIDKITFGSNEINMYLGEEWIYGEKTVSKFPGTMTSNTTGCPYITSLTGDSTPTKSKDGYWSLFNGNSTWSDGYNLDSGLTVNITINFAPGITFKPTSVQTIGPGYGHCIHGRIRIYDPSGTKLAERTSAGTTSISTNNYYSTLRVQFYASSESQVCEIYFAGVLRKEL